MLPAQVGSPPPPGPETHKPPLHPSPIRTLPLSSILEVNDCLAAEPWSLGSLGRGQAAARGSRV